MEENKQRFRELFHRWIIGSASISEEEELMERIAADTRNELFYLAMKQEWDIFEGLEVFTKEQQQQIIDKALEKNNSPSIAHRVHFLRRGWFRYAAAILLLFGVGSYLWISNKNTDQKLANNSKQSQTDILPGGEKAVLTLADGSKIVLDNAANGNLAQQGNAAIVKLANGQIAYNLKGLAGSDVMMNTMSTPKGGQYQLTLPDGSKVWLNAASSIQFPAVFVGATRNVKITGEVYLEVTKNKQKPFIVDVDGKSLIEVLGTSFNINSYENESSVKTTLVEGSVKILKGSKEAILKPGYQAVVADQQPDGKNSVIQVQVANVDQTLAWKNGIFNFDGLDLKSAMRQLERWYDIKVQYQRPVSDEIIFKGAMYRNANLSSVLILLKASGVRFDLDGKILIVL